MKDPFSPPYPYYYHETTIDRLPSILEHGLLSKNEAINVGVKDYKQNFKSSWNDNYVSVANDSAREVAAPEIAILINPRDLVIVEPSHIVTDTNRPIENELLIKDKISPKNFVGIVIGEVGYDYKLEKEVQPNPLKLEDVIKVLNQSNIKFNLPIYFKGKQIWPEAK